MSKRRAISVSEPIVSVLNGTNPNSVPTVPDQEDVAYVLWLMKNKGPDEVLPLVTTVYDLLMAGV